MNKFQEVYYAKAIWNDVVLAESEVTEIVEGNHYFPPDSVNRELTLCLMYFIYNKTDVFLYLTILEYQYTLIIRGNHNDKKGHII